MRYHPEDSRHAASTSDEERSVMRSTILTAGLVLLLAVSVVAQDP